MSILLRISFRFIQPFPLFHGRDDAGEPEWPPSPMRVFQALLNAACLRARGKPLAPEVRSVLQVIEPLRPIIVAPSAAIGSVGYRAYVPHNQADLVAAAWERGSTYASIASHRIEKDIRSHRIDVIGGNLPTVHYLYSLDDTDVDPVQLLSAIRPSVRSIYCLGWGIDQVVADATLVESLSEQLEGERWVPTSRGGRRFRSHRSGSLNALSARHEKFLKRLVQGNWTPVPPLTAFAQVRYRRDTDPLPRPYVVFKLTDVNDDTYRHPHGKLIHIAGMVRHLAINAMKRNPPPSIKDPAAWIEQYVAGHRNETESAANVPHTQLSYIPLPSIGHHHTDPSIRRVMIAAPIGDDPILEHLSQCLDGLRLKPEHEKDLRGSVFLRRARNDNVASFYVQPDRNQGYNQWASVTPVILPGHDDRKPQKTRKLIEKALIQSGINQPCEFEWSPFSYFHRMLPAYKYDREKRPVGYIRPDHLLNQTAVHLKLRFEENERVPGPLVIGSGRHYGFGLMAGIDQTPDMTISENRKWNA